MKSTEKTEDIRKETFIYGKLHYLRDLQKSLNFSKDSNLGFVFTVK